MKNFRLTIAYFLVVLFAAIILTELMPPDSLPFRLFHSAGGLSVPVPAGADPAIRDSCAERLYIVFGTHESQLVLSDGNFPQSEAVPPQFPDSGRRTAVFIQPGSDFFDFPDTALCFLACGRSPPNGRGTS